LEACRATARTLIPTDAFDARALAAEYVLGHPYQTGDPAPNDYTEFAPDFEAACAVLAAPTNQ
jgi:hypothetical protein